MFPRAVDASALGVVSRWCGPPGMQREADRSVYQYSETLMDHFLEPRNVGALDDAPWGEARQDICGDRTRIHVHLEQDRVARCTFLACGCGPGIACASWLTVRVIGRSVQEAVQVSVGEIARALELPEPKEHCAVLAVLALHRALQAAASQGLCSSVVFPRLEGGDVA